MTDRIMMQGSEHHFDYLVIAQKGAVALGIKPIVSEGYLNKTPVVFFGVRVRSAKNPTVETEELINRHILTEAWPGINFQNKDDSRASVNYGGPVVGRHHSLELAQNFHDNHILDQIVDHLAKIVGADMSPEIDSEELHDFLMEEYSKVLSVPGEGQPDNVISFADYFGKPADSEGKPEINIKEVYEEEDDEEDDEEDYDDDEDEDEEEGA